MTRLIDDLGAAAYLMMHLFKVTGKQGRSVAFEVPEEENSNFDSLYQEYLNSEFHRFDSCLMSLKKMR